jgi:hypothetical protein
LSVDHDILSRISELLAKGKSLPLTCSGAKLLDFV